MMKRACCLILLCVLLPAAAGAAGVIQVHQLMLGCADGYLIRTANGTNILIDAGRDTGDAPERVLTYLRALGVERIDVHILSHYHTDHAGNVCEINAAFGTPETVIYGPSDVLPDEYAAIAAGEYRCMQMGDKLLIDGVELLCVGPVTMKKQGWDNIDSRICSSPTAGGGCSSRGIICPRRSSKPIAKSCATWMC